MTHTIAYNSDSHTIEIKFQGNLILTEIEEICSEAIKIAKEQNCFLFLSDCSEATMKLSTFEIYDIPKILSDIAGSAGIPASKFKRALVVAKDLKDYLFFETVTWNRGQNTKVFQDIAEAKIWLSDQ